MARLTNLNQTGSKPSSTAHGADYEPFNHPQPTTMYQFSFEKLEVWQLARIFVNRVYKAAEKFLDREKFNLEIQIKRAAVSVMNNIAEGAGRSSYKEQA